MTSKCSNRSKEVAGTRVLAVFRGHKDVAAAAKRKAREEGMTFSQLMRRAIRKEIENKTA